ncbi:hypothetical protein [Streptomyces wuyuanensis]|uniref:hypothetical protein n=1 Tax=Streptomyces wuyuanensis TaxID=1196353 RepID=UPI001FCCDC36|nr:hypothetical protein [Streptomyces wuyuanensis]
MAAGVPASPTGRDGAKRVPGRKRGLAVQVLGLVIAEAVPAANTHDSTVGIAPLNSSPATSEKPSRRRSWNPAVPAFGIRLQPLRSVRSDREATQGLDAFNLTHAG